MPDIYEQVKIRRQEINAARAGDVVKNVQRASDAGNTPKDIVKMMGYPEEAEDAPYDVIAAVAVLNQTNGNLQQAVGMMPYIKAGAFPGKSTEEIATSLMKSGGKVPDFEVNRDFTRKRVLEEHAKYSAYAEARKKELTNEPKQKRLLVGKERWEKEFKPYLVAQLQEDFNNKYFSKSIQGSRILAEFYNNLWEAKTPEEVKKAKNVYANALDREQENAYDRYKALEYQILNNTADEGFWERRSIDFKGMKIRGKAQLADMSRRMMEALDTVGKGKTEAQGKAIDMSISGLEKFISYQKYLMEAPELSRENRGIVDRASSVIIGNLSNMGISIMTAVAGSIAGPAGVKAGIMYSAGCAESMWVRDECLKLGYSPEEANRRQNVMFLLGGMLEAIMGGVTKYKPTLTKKLGWGLIKKGGPRIGKVLLQELAEEIPQSVLEAALTDQLPYHADGSIDYKGVGKFLWNVSIDTAIMAGAYGGAAKGMSKVGDYAQRQLTGMSKDQVLALQEDFGEAMEKAMNNMRIWEMTPEEYDSYKAKGIKYEDIFYVRMPGGKDIEVFKNPTQKDYRLLDKEVRDKWEDMPKGEVTIRTTKDEKGNVYIWKADEGTHGDMDPLIHKYTGEEVSQNKEMPDHKAAVEKAVKAGEQVPIDVLNSYKNESWAEKAIADHPVSHDVVEPLQNIEEQRQFILVATGDGKYQIWDADKDIQYNINGEQVKKGETVSNDRDDVAQAITNANLGPMLHDKDMLKQLHRWAYARVKNGIMVEVYEPIMRLTDVNGTHQQRLTAAADLEKYVGNLRAILKKSFFKDFVNEYLPTELDSRLHALPDLWLKGRVMTQQKEQGMLFPMPVEPRVVFVSEIDKQDVAEVLSEIIKLAQMFGNTSQKDMMMNFVLSFIKKVKYDPGKKIVQSAKEAQEGTFENLLDMSVGTTAHDFLTSLTHLLGSDHILLSMKIIEARDGTTGTYKSLASNVVKMLVDDMGFDKAELADWSSKVGSKHQEQTLIPINLGGKGHKITLGELCWLNIALRDGRVGKAIEDRGLDMLGFKLNPLKDGEMERVQELLLEYPRAGHLVELVVDFYIDKRGPVVNKSSMEMLGHNIVDDHSFLPRPKGGGPVIIQDVFGALVEDIATAATYANIQPLMVYIDALTNNNEFITEAQRAGKRKHLDRFREQMSDMKKSSPTVQMEVEKVLTKIGRNRARAILSNLRIALLQVGSYQLYQNETATRYMRHAKVPQELIKTWNFFQFRVAGLGSVHSIASRSTVRKTLTGHEDLLNYALWPMHQVDLFTVRQASSIAWNEMAAARTKGLKGKPVRWWAAYGINPAELMDTESETFAKAFHDRATYLAYATQPMFFPESRNAYSQSNNTILREMARFRSFTDQLLRNLSRQHALYKQGEITAYEAAMSMGRTMVFATVWYNGLRAAIVATLGMFKDEEEKDETYLLMDIILGPLTWIPFIGWPAKTLVDAIATARWQGPADVSNIAFDQINKTMDSTYYLGRAVMLQLGGEGERAKYYWKKGTQGAIRDYMIMFHGLPSWLVGPRVRYDPSSVKGKKKSAWKSVRDEWGLNKTGKKKGKKKQKTVKEEWGL